MDPVHILFLLGAGALGGFIAGLVGVGGGIIFAPVLFYYFQAIGVPASVVAPLTVGTSLFCTTIASTVSAWRHEREGAVDRGIALRVGLLSFVVMFLVVQFVTTQAWYDRKAFELVFGTLLALVAIRMTFGLRPEPTRTEDASAEERASLPLLAGIGSAAGAVAASAGVGGGIILVPSFHHLLRKPLPTAVGTSSATIILISGLGVLTYIFSGTAVRDGLLVFGYVDIAHGLLLSFPTLLTAGLGATVAHRIDRRLLQLSFATIAGLVAIRMIIG